MFLFRFSNGFEMTAKYPSVKSKGKAKVVIAEAYGTYQNSSGRENFMSICFIAMVLKSAFKPALTHRVSIDRREGECERRLAARTKYNIV